MLTIKHVDIDGNEEILPTPNIRFQPKTNARSRATVWAEMPNGSARPFQSGKLYIMNSGGKTISRYLLDEPIGKDISALAANTSQSWEDQIIE